MNCKISKMGIKLLNKFLEQETKRSSCHLSKFANKKIAIDISIYLYQFKKESDNWLSKLYRMCIIFRHHRIRPIFVFDGFERSVDKNKTLEKRREVRHKLFEKIEEIEKMKDYEMSEENLKLLDDLKKKTKRPNRDDIIIAKELLDACGLQYIQPQGEADEVCVALVNKNIVYACLSNDTDMFALGCKRIMKNFNIISHNVDFYSLEDIVANLKMDIKSFKQLCVLSGTDYNFTNKNIFYFYKMYNKYNKIKLENLQFLEWLVFNRKITQQVYNEVGKVFELYDSNNSLKQFKFMNIKNSKLNINRVNMLIFG